MYKIKILLVALLITAAFATKAQSQKKFPLPKATVENPNQPSSLKNFLTKNPTVANVNWKIQDTIVIKLKNGKTQAYHLGNLQEKKIFEDNYGIAPVVPPPPPHQKKL